MKIESLNADQEAQLAKYAARWLKVGLSTTTDRAAAEAGVDRLYRACGMEPPRLKIWTQSPLAAALAIAIIGRLPEILRVNPGKNVVSAVGSAVDSAVGSAVVSAVDSAVDSAVGSAVGSAVVSAVDSAVGSAVDSAVVSAVDSAVRSAVVSAVDSAVGSAVDSAVGSAVVSAVDSAVDSAVGSAVVSAVDSAVVSAVDSAVGSAVVSAVDSAVRSAVVSAVDSAVGPDDWSRVYWWGGWNAGYCGYLSYMAEVLGVKIPEQGLAYIEAMRHAGWLWTFEHAVFLSDRPTEIHTNQRGQTHRDGGLAVAYGDGWGVWALNGVRMEKDLVERPAAELPAKLVLEAKNVEIRRELVRKIGIGRVMTELGAKVVDEMDSYQLVDLNLGDDRYRPYLKMKNPSIEEIHVEGVHPTCRTVKAALAWRNGMETYVQPKVLT